MMVDSTLVQVGKNLSEAMTILGNGHRDLEAETEKRSFSRTSIPGPLQGDGQDVATILQLVHNLIHEEEEEEKDKTSQCRMQNVGEQGHMALLGHSLAAYISVLDRERLRKLTTRIQSDTTLWLCRLFRYENGSAAFHDDDRDGLVKVCRLVINTRYEEYASEGYVSLASKQPVIYHSASGRPGLGQHLCSQLGLPLSSLCTVPCNTIFGSQHQMDVALLDKLIKEDIEAGKLPLLLIANAGTPGAGHTDKLGRLRDLCDQYNMWLHVEGVNLATLALAEINSTIMAATRCDSMTLTPGQWLGLPAVTAVTLYRHEDPALSLAAGLTSSQPVAKLRSLPLWLSLQYLGHNGIVHKIKHATSLSQQLLQKLKTLASIRTSDVLETEISISEALTMGKVWPIPPISGASLRDILGSLMLSIVEDELSSPVVLFKFSQETSAESNGGSVEGYCAGEKEVLDTFNKWLGERLVQLVPKSGVDVVELEEEGTCVRFSPLLTAAVLGTEQEDIDSLVEKLSDLVSVMSSTLSLRQDFREETRRHSPSLTYVEELSWPGLGVVRYEPQMDGIEENRRKQEVKKMNTELLKKLQEFDTEITFSTSPEFATENDDCIFVGMVTDDVDVTELVNTIGAIGRDIEESGRLLENMTDVIRKGILEAELQLQKASEEKLMEEGAIRQLPLVGSVLNWFSPVQSSVKGRTFNLVAGSLDSTELTYTTKAQAGGTPSQETPTPSKKRLSGQRLFQRASAGSDSFSETSSIVQVEETSREGCAGQSSSVHPPSSPPAPEADVTADVVPQVDSQTEAQESSQEKQPEDQEMGHNER